MCLGRRLGWGWLVGIGGPDQMTEGKLSWRTWDVDLGGDGRESGSGGGLRGRSVMCVMAGDLGTKGSEECRARARCQTAKTDPKQQKSGQRPARSSVPESRQSLILRDQAEGESRAGGGRMMLTDCELGDWVEFRRNGWNFDARGPVPP
jgi:hypothetical protein